MDVARKFGMISPAASSTSPVRAVFFVDPNAKIRAMIYYPAAVGRNFQEIKRTLIALQTGDAENCATPADWQPGDDVILHLPGSCGAATTRVENAGKDLLLPGLVPVLPEAAAGGVEVPAGGQGGGGEVSDSTGDWRGFRAVCENRACPPSPFAGR